MEWWARYEESRSNFDKAISYYRKAENYFATVRVLSFQNKVDEARKVVLESNDTAAAYQLARYYENSENVFFLIFIVFFLVFVFYFIFECIVYILLFLIF